MGSSRFPTEIQEVVDHLFREQYRRMVAILTRSFGADRFDLAETVVQDAIIKAMQTWPTQGVPDNPAAWLTQAAKNKALDVLRHEKTRSDKEAEIVESFAALDLENQSEASLGESAEFNPLLRDDQLRLIFICSHPLLSRETRVALTLKTLCGFGLNEIGRAFLIKPEAVEQRIVRAKKKIRDEKIPYEIPAPSEIRERLDSVLEVFYLLFNEGYSATDGEDLIRRDLCQEAIQLTSLLTRSQLTNTPKVHALLALMYFQSSRFDARVDAEGNLLLLSEQDRNRWDRSKIQRGFQHLNEAASGDELSDYHLQASIAACHASAPNYESTNWKQILSDYDELMLRHHTPVIALNRAVALGMVNGPEAAILELEKIEDLPPLKSYYLLPATLAEFYSRLGKIDQAAHYYAAALSLAGTEPEKRFLQKKLASHRAAKKANA